MPWPIGPFRRQTFSFFCLRAATFVHSVYKNSRPFFFKLTPKQNRKGQKCNVSKIFRLRSIPSGLWKIKEEWFGEKIGSLLTTRFISEMYCVITGFIPYPWDFWCKFFKQLGADQLYPEACHFYPYQLKSLNFYNSKPVDKVHLTLIVYI